MFFENKVFVATSKVPIKLAVECFALLGVAHFTDETLDNKRQKLRNELFKIIENESNT